MGKSLIQILREAGIDVEKVSKAAFEEALNFESHIPKGKNKKAEEQPEVVITIQDNNSDEPWEVKQMDGEIGIVLVHKGKGHIEGGIVGTISSPLDFIVLAEACDEMKRNILSKAADYAINRLFGDKGE